MITFGKWLIEQREAKGLSQNKFAERMKFSQAAVSRVEADKVEPSTAFLSAVADVLDLPAETVYRAAGMLPPVSEPDQWTQETQRKIARLKTPRYKKIVLSLIETLSQQEQEELKDRK